MINDLWYKNAVVYCLSVATYMDANGDGVGDFQGPGAAARFLAGHGDHRALADAVPAFALSRRWLRHRRLLQRRPAIWNAGRLRRVHPGLQPARHPRADRSGRQSHLERTPVVSRRLSQSQIAIQRLVRLVGEEAEGCRFRSGVSGRAEVHLDVGKECALLIIFTASTTFSRI